jgi:7-cyano-7-deazaguanine reductase
VIAVTAISPLPEVNPMGLEKFESPDNHVATFETDELTSLCPFDFGGPDHYDLMIQYKPAAHCLESKSLKLYLDSYRDEEITAERLATKLHRDITDAIEPEWLFVRLEQARRGGIEQTVEVGDRGN